MSSFIQPLVSTVRERLRFTYTNWKGVVRERTVVAEGIALVMNDNYPQPTWCLQAICTAKNEFRSFSLAGIHPETITRLDEV